MYRANNVTELCEQVAEDKPTKISRHVYTLLVTDSKHSVHLTTENIPSGASENQSTMISSVRKDSEKW